eukprot:gene16376-25104_t
MSRFAVLHGWAAVASAVYVSLDFTGNATIAAFSSDVTEVRLSAPVDHFVSVRCRSSSSAVTVTTSGARTPFCDESRLRWLRNGGAFPPTTATLPYTAGVCARYNERPCHPHEVCPGGYPVKLDPADESLVTTSRGVVVSIGSKRTCQSWDVEERVSNASADFRWICCAEDVCDDPQEGEVIIPPRHVSSYPSLLMLQWSRPGVTAIQCHTRGAKHVATFRVTCGAVPELPTVVFERQTVYVHPMQDNAVVRLRLTSPIRPSRVGGRAIVACEAAGDPRAVDARNAVITEATYSLWNDFRLYWPRSTPASPSPDAPRGEGGGLVLGLSTETVTCTVSGASPVASSASVRVVKRRGASLRFVDAFGHSLDSLVLREDRSFAGFGVEVTHAPSVSSVDPPGHPGRDHQLRCVFADGRGADSASNGLQLLSPVPLEFSAADPAFKEAGYRVYWFGLRRLARQYLTYRVQVRCQNIRHPNRGFGTLWELHPDELVVSRWIVVEAPVAVPAHQVDLSLRSVSPLVSSRKNAFVDVALTRPALHALRVQCSSPDLFVSPAEFSLPGARGDAAGDGGGSLPLLDGDQIALSYHGAQYRYQGAPWVSCGSVGGCTFNGCPGDEMDSAEWEYCAENTFILSAATPADDPLGAHVRREGSPVRNGDAIFLRSSSSPQEMVDCTSGTCSLARCLDHDPPTDGDFQMCNATFRVWAHGKSVGVLITRSDTVAFQWTSSSSDASSPAWFSCNPLSPNELSDHLSDGGRECSATWYDTCIGPPPTRYSAAYTSYETFRHGSSPFLIPASCHSYRFRLSVRANASNEQWKLFSHAAEAPVSSPLLGDAVRWARVPDSARTVSFATSGHPVSLLVGPSNDTLSASSFGEEAEQPGVLRFNIGANGTYELRSYESTWLRRDGLFCSVDYTVVKGDVAACKAACLNTTGCAGFSYPHYDGCRVHAGELRSCEVAAAGSENETTATVTASLGAAEAAQNAAAAEMNAAAVIGGGRSMAVSVGGMVGGGASFSVDLRLRPVGVRERWVLAGEPPGAAVSGTFSVQRKSSGRVVLRDRSNAACLPRPEQDRTGADGWSAASDVFATYGASADQDVSGYEGENGLCAAESEVQWVAMDAGGRGWLLHSDDRFCVSANGTLHRHGSEPAARCGVWRRTVEKSLSAAADDAAGPLHLFSKGGSGLFLSAAGHVSVAVAHGGARVEAESRTPLLASAWSHVAGVFDSDAQRLFLFVNGALEASASTAYTQTSGVEPGTMAAVGAAGPEHHALIDDLGVWPYAISFDVVHQRMRCVDPGVVARAPDGAGGEYLAWISSSGSAVPRSYAGPRGAPVLRMTFSGGSIAPDTGQAFELYGAYTTNGAHGYSCRPREFTEYPAFSCGGLGDLHVGIPLAQCEETCVSQQSCLGFTHDARGAGGCFFVFAFADPVGAELSPDLRQSVRCFLKSGGDVRTPPSRILPASPAGCSASTSLTGTTCFGAFDGVRSTGVAGEWVSSGEAEGAWLEARWERSFRVTRLRVAQRLGSVQADGIRVCFDDGACERFRLAPMEDAAASSWENIELAGGGRTTTRVSVVVDSVHPLRRSADATTCANYTCPFALEPLDAASWTACGGPGCTAVDCCHAASIGFQELEFFGHPPREVASASGVLGRWCAAGPGPDGAEFPNAGLLRGAFSALPGAPFERLARQSCGGGGVQHWSSGVAAQSGRVDLSLDGCKRVCSDNAVDCKGFEYREADGACTWKTGSLAPGNATAADSDCLLAIPGDLGFAANGSVAWTPSDVRRRNETACRFADGALATTHFAAPLPLSVSLWVSLGDDGRSCNVTGMGAVLLSWSSGPRGGGQQNTLSISSGGSPTWTVVNGTQTQSVTGNATAACDGAWHLVSLSVSTRGETRFEVDGEPAGGGCCAVPMQDTSYFVIGGTPDAVISGRFTGHIFDLRLSVGGSTGGVSAAELLVQDDPGAEAGEGAYYQPYRHVPAAVVSGAAALAAHGGTTARECKALCTADERCRAAEYATGRDTPLGPAQRAQGTCTLLPAGRPVASAAAVAGLENVDVFVKGAGVVHEACGVLTLGAEADAEAREGNGEGKLRLGTDGDAIFVQFDLPSTGVDEDVADAVLTLHLEDPGVVAWYPLDLTLSDRAGFGGEAAATAGVAFPPDASLSANPAAFLSSAVCPSVAGAPVFSATVAGGDLGWMAWVNPEAGSGQVVAVEESFSLYFQNGFLFCALQGEVASFIASSTEAVMQTGRWQHVGCQAAVDGKVLQVLHNFNVVGEVAWTVSQGVRVVSESHLVMGCDGTRTYAGRMKDVKVLTAKLPSEELHAQNKIDSACGAVLFEVSAVEPGWTQASLHSGDEPAVLSSSFQEASPLSAASAVSFHVGQLVKSSSAFKITLHDREARSACNRTLSFHGRTSAGAANSSVAPRLTVVTGCPFVVASPSAEACAACFDGYQSTTCDTPAATIPSSSPVPTLQQCKAGCSSIQGPEACRRFEWDAATGNCTWFAAGCRAGVSANETVAANVGYAPAVLYAPLSLRFDARDAFAHDALAFTAGILRLQVAEAPRPYGRGGCAVLVTVRSLTRTAPSRVVRAEQSLGAVFPGDFVLVRLPLEDAEGGGPLLEVNVTTDCVGEETARNASIGFASGSSTDRAPPALLLGGKKDAVPPSFGVRSYADDGFVRMVTTKSSTISQTVHFHTGGRPHGDTTLAWLRTGIVSSHCSSVEVTLRNTLFPSRSPHTQPSVILSVPAGTHPSVTLDVTDLIQQAPPSQNTFALSFSAHCSEQAVEYADRLTVASVLHVVYDRTWSVKYNVNPQGEVAVLREGEEGALFEFEDVPYTGGRSMLVGLVQDVDEGAAALCESLTVRSVGRTGYVLGSTFAPAVGGGFSAFLGGIVASPQPELMLYLQPRDCAGRPGMVAVFTRAALVAKAADEALHVELRCARSQTHSFTLGAPSLLGGNTRCQTVDDRQYFVADGSPGTFVDIRNGLTFPPHHDFTVVFKFVSTFARPPVAGDTGFLFHKTVSLGGGQRGLGLLITDAGTALELWTANASRSGAVSVGAGFFLVARWYAVQSFRGGLRLFVDGTLLLSWTPPTPPALHDTSAVRLGASAHDAADGKIRGFFADFQVYRAALSRGRLGAAAPAAFYERHAGEILGFAQAGVAYERAGFRACRGNFFAVRTGGEARCKKACAATRGCVMFSLDTETGACRVHDGQGRDCSPGPGGGHDVLVTLATDPASALPVSRGLSTVHALWMTWTDEELVFGYGMTPKDILFRGGNRVPWARKAKYLAFVQTEIQRLDATAWLYIETAPVEHIQLKVVATATAGHIATLTCEVASSFETPSVRKSGAVYPCARSVPTGYTSLLLQVLAGENIEVVFSRKDVVADCTDPDAYSITMDELGHEESTVMRRGMCGDVIARRESDLVTLGGAAWFWVAFGGPYLSMGRGQVPGQSIFLTSPQQEMSPFDYVHVGTTSAHPVSVGVYFDAHVVLRAAELVVSPGKSMGTEVTLEVDLFNTSELVEVFVDCEALPSGIVVADTAMLYPFSPGDEQGQKMAHYVKVHYIAPGSAMLYCWVREDVPPYYVAMSNVSIPVRAVPLPPAGLGFTENVVLIRKYTTAYAHLHFGSVRLPVVYGNLLHVAKPAAAKDTLGIDWIATNGSSTDFTVPSWAPSHCSMLFRSGQGFASHVPRAVNSLSFAATLLPAGCAVDALIAQDCCPILSTGYHGQGTNASSVALAMCGARTLRFGVLPSNSAQDYVDVSVVVNDTWIDVLALKDSVTNTLSLYINGSLVALSTRGGDLQVGSRFAGSQVVAGGGCYWRVQKGMISSCEETAAAESTVGLQQCVDRASRYPSTEVNTVSYSENGFAASTGNCRLQRCQDAGITDLNHFRAAISDFNVTATLRSCPAASYEGYIRRVRAWDRAVGYAFAFPQPVFFDESDPAYDCSRLVGDHDRLRGSDEENEPNGDMTVTCTVHDSSVVRLRDEDKVFVVKREAYGDLVSIPLEYVAPGKTVLRCSADAFVLNDTNALLRGSNEAVTAVTATSTPGWTRLPNLPGGAFFGCALFSRGVLTAFMGNTALQFVSGEWVPGPVGSGLAFDGCSCFDYKEEGILLYGCAHGRVLLFDPVRKVFRAKVGYPTIQGFQMQSPVHLNGGALVRDTNSGTWVGLRFDTRTVQRMQNPRTQADPLVASPQAASLGSEEGVRVFVVSAAVHSAAADELVLRPDERLAAFAESLRGSQRAFGSHLVNLCGAVAAVGGVPLVAGGGSELADAPVLLFETNEQTGDAEKVLLELPRLERGVMGGAATAGGGGLFVMGGLQGDAAGEDRCRYGGGGAFAGNGTDAVWGCQRGVQTGYAGSVVVGFEYPRDLLSFSVALASSVCPSGPARPASNARGPWNPCNGYVRVVVEPTVMSLHQVVAGVSVQLAAQAIDTLPSSRQSRYLWVKWLQINARWTVQVGRGPAIGAYTTVSAAMPAAVHVGHVAFAYGVNDSTPTSQTGLWIHSLVTDGVGSRTVQALTHLSEFGERASCGAQGSCDSSTGVCACANPAKTGSSCQSCAADFTGPACRNFKPCSDLYPLQPHLAEECEGWRTRGCRSVAFEAEYLIPSLNQTIKRYRLNT